MEYASGGELFDLLCQEVVIKNILKIFKFIFFIILAFRKRSQTFIPTNNFWFRIFTCKWSISSRFKTRKYFIR